MTTQPVANPVPTAGMTGAPGQEMITPPLPLTTAGAFDAPAPEAQVGNPGHAEYPGQQPPDSPAGVMTAPPGVGADAGNDDKMESTVPGAVAAAQARNDELHTDLYGMGSTVGDLMDLPTGSQSKVTGPPSGYSSET